MSDEGSAGKSATSGTSITYIGHGTVLIEMDGVRIITDPVLRRWVGPLRRYGPLPDPTVHHHIDAVLISHLHLDHLDLPSLRLLPHSPVVIGPPLTGQTVHRVGFKTVVETRRETTLRFGELEIAAVHAKHTRRRWVVSPATEPLGFLIHGSSTVYFAGDTALFDGMENLHERIDIALLPIETWGARVPEHRHLSPSSAAHALTLLKPRLAVPIHWGTLYLPGSAYTSKEATYAWFQRTRRRPEQFATQAAELAPETGVCILDPGQSLTVDAAEPPEPRPEDAAASESNGRAPRVETARPPGEPRPPHGQ